MSRWCNFLVVLCERSSSAIHEMPPKFDPNEIKVGMFMVSGDMFRLACQKLCVRDIGLKLFFSHKVT